MSAPMPFPQFRELLRFINEFHSPLKTVGRGRVVTYVMPSIDMRTGTVFHIEFRGAGWQKTMYIMNEQISNPKSLYDRCVEFLDDLPGAEGLDPQDTKTENKALKALVNVLLGELGKNLTELGGAFGTENIKFTIPVSLLEAAIKESANVSAAATEDSNIRKHA